MNSKRIDISVGAALSVFSTAVFLYANQYKGKGVSEYGPNVFPQAMAILLFITSILLMVNAVRGNSQTDLEGIHLTGLIRSGITVGISIIYLILMQFLGFFLSTVIFLYVMMTYLGQKGQLKRIISTLAVSVVIYAIFNNFLKIPMPEGLFQRLF
ncbi:MAG: tripartite tricarboxylate transporter TctB family protein [Spirochaetales bacterium]|nr:tripartite tricarboxylate transporter TctB family protein [Spirochaetales bacterium]